MEERKDETMGFLNSARRKDFSETFAVHGSPKNTIIDGGVIKDSKHPGTSLQMLTNEELLRELVGRFRNMDAIELQEMRKTTGRTKKHKRGGKQRTNPKQGTVVRGKQGQGYPPMYRSERPTIDRPWLQMDPLANNRSTITSLSHVDPLYNNRSSITSWSHPLATNTNSTYQWPHQEDPLVRSQAEGEVESHYEAFECVAHDTIDEDEDDDYEDEDDYEDD